MKNLFVLLLAAFPLLAACSDSIRVLPVKEASLNDAPMRVPAPNQETKKDAKSLCGVQADFGSGSINSPNYPTGYPTDLTCLYQIGQPNEEESSIVYFNDFDLEPNADWVEVREVNRTGELLAVFTGTEGQDEIVRSFFNLVVLFYSDDGQQNTSVTYRGFNFTYYIGEEFCISVHADGAGEISSITYPNPYQNNINCTYFLGQAGKQTFVAFDDIDLEQDKDFIEVRSQNSVGVLLARFTGNNAGECRALSYPDRLWVNFFTDASNNGDYDGFHANYRIGNPIGTCSAGTRYAPHEYQKQEGADKPKP